MKVKIPKRRRRRRRRGGGRRRRGGVEKDCVYIPGKELLFGLIKWDLILLLDSFIPILVI